MHTEQQDEQDPITPAPEWIFKIGNLLSCFLHLPLQQEPFNLTKDTADRIQRLVLELLDGNISPEAFLLELRMAFHFVPLYRPTSHWVPLFQVTIPIIRQLLKADAAQRDSLLAQLFASSQSNQEQPVKEHEQKVIAQQQQQQEQYQRLKEELQQAQPKKQRELPKPPKRSSSLLYFIPSQERNAASELLMSHSLYAPQLQQNCSCSLHSKMSRSMTDINSVDEAPFHRATLPRIQPANRAMDARRQLWQQQQMMAQQKQEQLQQLHAWVESQQQQHQQLQLQLQLQRQQQQQQPQQQPQLQPLAQPQQRQMQVQLQQPQQQLQPQQDPIFSLTRGSTQLQQVIAEQRNIYVCADRLSELSPYFALSFADLDEFNGQQPLVLDDSYENVLEMLRCILPCEFNGYQLKPITESNFSTLVRMADKYVIARLLGRCEEFVLQDFKYQRVEEATVLTMLKTAASVRQFNKEALAEIIGRAATCDVAVLKSANLLSLPAHVSNALHFAKHDYVMSGPEKCSRFEGRGGDVPIVPSARVDMQLLL